MIRCYPSGRLMTPEQYWAIYRKVLAEREAYWTKHFPLVARQGR